MTGTQPWLRRVRQPARDNYFPFSASHVSWQVFPFAVTFRGYHQEHHKYQGVDGVDTDIPCDFECKFVQGTGSKTVWATCQILAYALRPCIVRMQTITKWHVFNIISQLAFDAVMLKCCGVQPFIFNVLSIFLAGGLHPCAGHFISEHYVFPHKSGEQETYSYYGILNRLTWNVGYHNEHHDFP